MKNWSVHWLGASGTLAPWSETINQEFSSAYTKIGEHFQVPRLDVLLCRSKYVIPEIGMVGRAYSPTLFSIDFDPDNTNFETCHSDGTLQRQIAHEIHHCMRMAGPGYGSNLGEVLVSEGLAGQFSRLLYNNPPEPWERALSSDDAFSYLPDKRDLNAASYDHNAWFFGSRGRYPRWLGYTLGYGIVARWIENTGSEASDQIIDVDAKTVLAAVRRG